MKQFKMILGFFALLIVVSTNAQISTIETPEPITKTLDFPNALIDVQEATRQDDSTFVLSNVSLISYKNYPYIYTRDSFKVRDVANGVKGAFVLDNKGDRFEVVGKQFSFGNLTLTVEAKNQTVKDNPSYIYGSGNGLIYQSSPE